MWKFLFCFEVVLCVVGFPHSSTRGMTVGFAVIVVCTLVMGVLAFAADDEKMRGKQRPDPKDEGRAQ
jgi:hypothetical protein